MSFLVASTNLRARPLEIAVAMMARMVRTVCQFIIYLSGSGRIGHGTAPSENLGGLGLPSAIIISLEPMEGASDVKSRWFADGFDATVRAGQVDLVVSGMLMFKDTTTGGALVLVNRDLWLLFAEF